MGSLDTGLAESEKLRKLTQKELYVHHKVISREMRENLVAWTRTHKTFNASKFINSANRDRPAKIGYDSDIAKAYGLVYDAMDCLNRRDDAKGLNLMEKALGLDPGNEEALKIKMDVLMNTERFDESVACADKLIEMKGLKSRYYSEAYFDKAAYIAAYAFERRSSSMAREALAYLDEGLSHDDENWDLVMEKAVVLYQLGENDYVKWLDRAKELDPERAERFIKDVWFSARILR